MKIKPKTVSSRKISFWRNGRRIYKALNNGNTDDWIYNWYEFNTNYYTPENFKKWRTLDVSKVKNAPHSSEYRVGLTAQPNDVNYNDDSWTNTSALLTKWQNNNNREKDIVNAAKVYIQECKQNKKTPTLEDFIKWYNNHISNMYDYFNKTASRIKENESPYFRNDKATGDFNDTNKLIYNTANSKDYIGYNERVKKDAGISTWTRFVDVTEDNITNLDFSNIEDETLKNVLSGIIKHKSGALGTRAKSLAKSEEPIIKEPVIEEPVIEEPVIEEPGNPVFTDIKAKTFNTEPNKFGLIVTSILPGLASFGRLWNTIRTNNKISKILLDSLHPVLHNTYEKYSPVTGAFSTMQAYNQQAADINRLADRNATSDASLNLAARLEANKLANQYRMQGFLADDLQIQKTAQAALERLEDNMARRSLIANENMDSIYNVNYSRALARAARLLKNNEAIDEFLREKETDIRKKLLERKENVQAINEAIISSDYTSQLYRLQEKWQEAHPGSSQYAMYSDPTYLKAKRELLAIIAAKQYKNLLNDNQYSINTKGVSTEEEFWKNLRFHKGGKIIPMLQSGGNPFSSYFLSYESAERPKPKTESSSSKSKDKSKNDIGEKDFANLLKNAQSKMLPNEGDLITSSIYGLMQAYANGLSDTMDSITLYGSIMGELNRASFNKEQFDEVRKLAEKDGILNDYAITPSGAIIVLEADGNGELIDIPVTEYLQNRNKYIPVYNGALLKLRANHPSFVNDNTIFEIVENGVSLNTVVKDIKERLLKIGTSKTTLDNSDVQELSELASTVQGREKIRQVIKEPTKYSKDFTSINAALEFLYNTLPDNEKIRLLLQTNGNPEEVKALITEYIISGIDTEYSMTTSGKSDKSGKGSSSDLSKSKSNDATDLVLGRGIPQVLTINSGTDTMLVLYGYSTPIRDMKGNNIGINKSFADVLNNSMISRVIDTQNISIGGKPIDSLDAAHGTVLKDQTAYIVTCPYTQDGYNIVPVISLDLLKAQSEADLELSKTYNIIISDKLTPDLAAIVNKVYNEHNLDQPYNLNGSLKQNYKRFVVFNVYLDKSLISDDVFDNNQLIFKEKNRNTRDRIAEIINGKPKLICYSTMWVPLNDLAAAEMIYNAKLGEQENLIEAQSKDTARREILSGASNVNLGQTIN